jgi:uncharacterized protein with GYD domain
VERLIVGYRWRDNPCRWKEDLMAKFLVKASYSADGARGLIKEGGTRRRNAVQQMVEGLGGRLEAFYFAYGESDVYAIADVPDATAGIALSLAVNASGSAQVTTIPLITPEEVDDAAKKTVAYRPPGA